MQIDLTQLTPGQIAVVAASATVLAALIGGAFGVGVAAVNAWSAQRLARQAARRDYRIRVLEPFLARLDEDVPRLTELVRLLYRKSTSLTEGPIGEIGRRTAREDDAKLREHFANLVGLNNYIDNISPAVRSLIRSDVKLQNAWFALREAREVTDTELGVGNMMVGEGAKLESGQKTALKDGIEATIEAIVQLRIATEKFIYA